MEAGSKVKISVSASGQLHQIVDTRFSDEMEPYPEDWQDNLRDKQAVVK